MPHRRATLRVLRGCILACATSLAGCAADGSAHPPGRLGLGLADSALSGGAPGLALQVSKAVLARNPNDVPALLRRGDAYSQLGDYARAAASYRRAATLDPCGTAPLMGLGRVALATDPAEASARFSQVLAIRPDDQAALSDRGIAADLGGMHAEAQADYRRAIALGQAEVAQGLDAAGGDGALAATTVNLAVSLAITGRADEAVRLLRPIAGAPDATPRVQQDLALALTLDGRVDEAAHLLLSQMSQAQARDAMAAYQALRINGPIAARSGA